jgi:hypothetical protein
VVICSRLFYRSCCLYIQSRRWYQKTNYYVVMLQKTIILITNAVNTSDRILLQGTFFSILNIHEWIATSRSYIYIHIPLRTCYDYGTNKWILIKFATRISLVLGLTNSMLTPKNVMDVQKMYRNQII